jgi:predicted dehydrogenase
LPRRLWQRSTSLAAGDYNVACTTSHLKGPAMLRPSLLGAFLVSTIAAAALAQEKPLKVGIIGLDTSHAIAFTRELNHPQAGPDVAGCPVVAAYPKGSPDIESSVSRVPGYTAEMQKLGVEIVDSIDELLKRVDCVLLETNDGRPHLEQALPVFKAGKPVFIDKPVAGSLADAIAIYKAAEKFKCPTFSSSSLRYAKGAQELRGGALGKILGCDAFSPCSLEPTHPDLYWYGIHGCETLFTVMGPGCESVTRVSTPEFDLAVGKWSDGRIGTYRGIRSKGGSGYGGTAFGERGIREIGPYGGYRPLIVEIVKFFRSRQPPIDPKETLELYAFMEAADESKRRGGAPATIAEVMQKAEPLAEKRLAELGVK